jgi:hypothetical protein
VGQLEGFSPDGQTLITTNVVPLWGYSDPNPEICRWDAATGQLLGRVKLACPDLEVVRGVRTSPDGRLALVGEAPDGDGCDAWSTTQNWYVHDAITGRRLATLTAGRAAAPRRAFSNDGRWFMMFRDREPSSRCISIFSAASAKVVLDLPEQQGRNALSCSFAPDGTTAAVISYPRVGNDNHYTVHIVEVPRGMNAAISTCRQGFRRSTAGMAVISASCCL